MNEKGAQGVPITFSAVASLPIPVLALTAEPQRMLIAGGCSGELAVLKMGERSYVEIEALTRVVNGCRIFNGNQMVLTLPGAPASTSGAASASQSVPPGLSKEFIRAGIEEIYVIRERRSNLTNAVQRGYPITDDWIAAFRDRTRQNLRSVSVAASTESDIHVVQSLTNVSLSRRTRGITGQFCEVAAPSEEGRR